MEESIGVGPAHIVFMVLFLCIVTFMAIWVVGVTVRLKYPERVHRHPRLPAPIRRTLIGAGRLESVGLRDIREYERMRAVAGPVEYRYQGLARHEVPDAWVTDVARRCN